MIRIFLLLSSTILMSCSSDVSDPLKNTVYKMGFKTNSFSTGPQSNSAFVLKINDTLPSVLVTAHHVVAGIGNDQYVKWDEVASKQENAWAWSMYDTAYNFKVGENLPIRNAETMKLDIAAFFLPNHTIPGLPVAHEQAQVGDTVYLHSIIQHQDKITLLNPGLVIFTSDSMIVYELIGFNMARIMSGTSGSAVINGRGQVISNSIAGFTIPSDEEKQQLATLFPLLAKVETKTGKSYGAGIPIRLIESSLIRAFAERNRIAP